MVVFTDAVVVPDPGVGQGGDQPLAVTQLQHVRGAGAVGPGVGALVRIVEVEAGIEGEKGRAGFVVQIEPRQLRLLLVAGRFALGVCGIAVLAGVLLQIEAVCQQVTALAVRFVP